MARSECETGGKEAVIKYGGVELILGIGELRGGAAISK